MRKMRIKFTMMIASVGMILIFVDESSAEDENSNHAVDWLDVPRADRYGRRRVSCAFFTLLTGRGLWSRRRFSRSE